MISLKEELVYCHLQLNELFLLHQEALLANHLDAASQLLDLYWATHAVHMHFEDDVLIPEYARLEKPGRWDATLYSREHQKIEDLYGRIRLHLDLLLEKQPQDSVLRRQIIALLDLEKTYKGLCEHHQEREEQSLLVELDGQTDADWCNEVLGSFHPAWEKQMRKVGKSIPSPYVFRPELI